MRRSVEFGLGGRHKSEFRNIGLSERDESSTFEARREKRIVIGRQVGKEPRRLSRGHALGKRENIFQEEWHAGEGAFR